MAPIDANGGDTKAHKHLCNFCGAGFAKKHVLTQHIYNHTGERPYLCDICGIAFKAKAHMDRHFANVHEDEKNFECGVCGKRFATKHQTLLHCRTHTKEEPEVCAYCGERFRRPADLNAHGKKAHPQLNSVVHSCGQCGKKFNVLSMFCKHILNCQNPNLPQQNHDEEAETLIRKIAVPPPPVEPTRSETEAASNVIQTDMFNETSAMYFPNISFSDGLFQDPPLSTPDYYNTSVDDEPPPSPEKQIPCPFCDTHTASLGLLKVHILVHVKDWDFLCRTCGEQCKSSEKLEAHMRRHEEKALFNNSLPHIDYDDDDNDNMSYLDAPFSDGDEDRESDHKDHSVECKDCVHGFTGQPEMLRHVAEHLKPQFPASSRKTSSINRKRRAAVQSASVRGRRVRSATTARAGRDVARGGRKRSKPVCWVRTAGKRGKGGNVLSYQYACKDCGKVFHSDIGCRDHNLRVHQKQYRFTCNVCNKKFMNKTYWRDHEMAHMNVRQYSCDQCDASYKYNKDLKEHKQTKHGADGGKEAMELMCLKCLKTFSGRRSLSRHQEVCIKGRRFQCTLCPFITNYRVNFKRHLDAHHKDSGLTIDDIIPIKPKKEEVILPIPLPPQESVVLSIDCPICGKSFASETGYRDHDMKVHKKVFRHSCKVCDKKFMSETHLKNHELAHFNEKRFGCDQCDCRYTHKKDLIIHQQMKHLGMKFECPKCLSSFNSPTYLNKHKQTCIHNRKFPCTICPFVANFQSNLTRHMRTKHGFGPQKPPTVLTGNQVEAAIASIASLPAESHDVVASITLPTEEIPILA